MLSIATRAAWMQTTSLSFVEKFLETTRQTTSQSPFWDEPSRVWSGLLDALQVRR